MITVDAENKTYQYNHEYYLMKHVSHFVKPGAKLLNSSGTFTNILAFENIDKSLKIVVQNAKNADKQITFKVDDKNIQVMLKAGSFNTLIIQ